MKLRKELYDEKCRKYCVVVKDKEQLVQIVCAVPDTKTVWNQSRRDIFVDLADYIMNNRKNGIDEALCLHVGQHADVDFYVDNWDLILVPFEEAWETESVIMF